MPSALEWGVEPQRENLVGQPEGHDAAAHREDVGVVVLPGEAGSVRVVAQGGPNAGDLVGRDLLPLPAAAEHDAAIGASCGDGARHLEADGRIVDGLFAVRAAIVHGVAKPAQRRQQVLFEKVAGMIGSDGDAHGGIVLWRSLSMMPTVVVSARGEQRLRSGHPWVYRADLVEVRAGGGDRVVIVGARGRTVGHGFYSDRSQIALRLLTDGDDPADDGLIRRRLEAALAFRDGLRIDATAYRVIHGEADLLPSLVVDRYGDYLVVQTLSQGMDRLQPLIVSALADLLQPRGILARNDPRTRALEGLDRRVEVLAGEVPESTIVSENGNEFDVDLRRGQKTGLFLDQRENRAAATVYARGRALDCFSYNGGFALGLARVARETIAVDVSADAVARLQANARRNGVSVDARVGNVFDELRGLERIGERFDTIVLDPPAFAKSKPAVAKATAGYKEINLRALKLLNPGGTLVTCSCSYHVNEAAFAQIVYEASVDAQAHVTVVEKRMQGRDHPVLLGVPETYYLKCFILRKLP